MVTGGACPPGGLARSTVNLIENGMMLGYASQLEKLAQALGVSRVQLERLLRTSERRPVRRPKPRRSMDQ
jgi:transcriptional regulator with XRE-family HTH domain